MGASKNRWIVLLVVIFFVSGYLHAQSPNAEISGLVTDSAGAAVSGSGVTALNVETGVPYTTKTNGSGVYLLQQLVPGSYKITVSRQGFGNVVRSGLTLRTGDVVRQNFTLAPGAISQTVVVSSAAPLISTDQATTSVVLSNKIITDLPQLNRNPLDLTATIPSVQGKGPLSDVIGSLGTSGYEISNNGTSYSVAGGQVNGPSIIVDGNLVQEAEFNAVNRAIPTPDSIGEFRVDYGALTANYGRYSGGVISMQTKGGTNTFHGRVFEYFRNQSLNSNDWMNNALGVPRQSFSQNNYGLSVGGPVSLPRLYSGKNRTFFFFGWEGERFSQSLNVRSSVPTLLNQQGDFSQTVINYQNGQPVYANIYDPFHGYEDGGGNWVRPQFPGNKIPVAATGGLSGQSQLFAHYMALWPDPNHAPDAGSDHANNYYSTIDTTRPTDRFFLRLDENLSNNHRLNFTLSRLRMTNTIPAPYFHTAESVTNDHDWLGSLIYNWVISPTTIMNLHVGFGTAKLVSDGVSGIGSAPDPAIDVTKWGFDPLILSNPSRTVSDIPPALSIPGYTNVGGSEFDSFIYQTTNGSASLTKIVARHTLRVGYEQYFSRFDEDGGDHTGVAWVNPGGGSNQFWNQNDGLTGSPLAELMMGSSNVFQWGNWNITPFGWDQAAYAMDDWKVNSKLTVQMGIRWDHDGGRQTRDPRASSPLMYDINAKNVLQSNGNWDWSQVTDAEPGLSGLPTPQWLTQGATGRVVLLNSKEYPQKNLYTTNWANFQPRLGISYAINNKTAVHASGGIVYEGLNGLSTDWYSYAYNTNTMNQIPTLDGKHWVSEFGNDHGLGTFPLQPNGTNLGFDPPVSTNAEYGFQTFGGAANPDQGGAALLPHQDSPEDYMWGLNVQRQVGNNWVFTAEYQGIRGIHLLMPVNGWSLNNISPSYYSLGAKLLDQVPNPFYGQSQIFASEPTVPLYQLLGLSPQYTQTTPGQATWGKSFSNFANFQVQTRTNHGLTVLASYAIRKTLTNTEGKDPQHSGTANIGLLQNPHNLMEGYGLALYEKPQTIKLTFSYDLPIGHGRQFLGAPSGFGGHLLDAVAGGWGIAGISIWDPKGTPVLAPTVDGGVTVPGAALRWSLVNNHYVKGSKNYNQGVYVNGAFVNSNGNGIFQPAAFARTPDYSFGNAPFVYSNVRNPGDFSTDGTLMKNFPIGRDPSRYIEARIEATNVFNHPTFGSIDNDPDSPTFGGVNGKSGSRIMQIGFRFFY